MLRRSVMRPPLRDVVLVVRAFSQNARALRPHLKRLDGELGGAVLRIDAHFRRSSDVAMFVCRLDLRALPPLDPLAQLAERMRNIGGELIDMVAIGPEQEGRLRDKIIPRCEIACREVVGLSAAVDALLAATGLRPMAAAPKSEPPPRLRFLRGHTWQTGRLGRITDDRLYVITSAPLRAGERTSIEVSAPSVSARFTAEVTDDAECTAPGTWGFTARILVDGPRKLSDQNVLTWARARLADAQLMPARTEHRIPLAWPARLRDQTGEQQITMRDVSVGGIFAEMPRMPEGSIIQLRVPFDLGDAPLELDAEVARVVDRDLAEHHGIPIGVGLRVRPVGRDTDRYPAFVSRVTERAARHVLIGARKPRLEELVRHFASVGYLTTGVDDLRVLCARATDANRPPEVLLVDPGLATLETLRPRLGRITLPVLAIEGNPINARRLVDAALLT
jgi:hypothetical protein